MQTSAADRKAPNQTIRLRRLQDWMLDRAEYYRDLAEDEHTRLMRPHEAEIRAAALAQAAAAIQAAVVAQRRGGPDASTPTARKTARYSPR